MYDVNNQNIALQGIGLNGFWGSLWNSFKRAIGLRYDDENVTGFGARLGNLIGRVFNTLTAGAIDVAAGAIDSLSNKGIDYEPTAQEITILNPIITSLNNFLLQLTEDCDNAVKSGLSPQNKVAVLNNALRKLQLVQNHFASQPLTTISANAQTYLANEIYVMVALFEATIDDLLTGNNIDFAKIEGDLAVNLNDVYPANIKPSSSVLAYGVQYEIPANTQAITGNAPTQTNNTNIPIKVAEPTGTTTAVAGLNDTKNKPLAIAFALFAIAGLVALFSGENSKKN